MIENKGLIRSLTLLRILIGWHFLYEGISKAYNPSWTAKGYLLGSESFLSGFYSWLASDSMIGFTDFLNIGALILVGILLIIGYFEKPAAFIGALLLLSYYLAYPSFPGLNEGVTEGNYWIVNKNLIESVALLVIYFQPTSHYFGLKTILNTQN